MNGLDLDPLTHSKPAAVVGREIHRPRRCEDRKEDRIDHVAPCYEETRHGYGLFGCSRSIGLVIEVAHLRELVHTPLLAG